MQELSQRLVSWLKEQVEQAGCRGVVFGLSGGVDSSVVGVLCKQAFPHSSLGVMMPCHSIDEDIEDAQIVAQKFGILTVTVKLDEVFDSLLKALPDLKCESATPKKAEGNVKSRLRMNVLYYIAAKLNYLVVGTSNKVELSVGYFTKYGDGGVDIMPLANLMKQDVIELARYLDIPEKIITKPPSGGLWPGQTDEGEMGITYKELDRYLATGQAKDEIRRRIDNMVKASAHKRNLPAVPPF
ncbi:MAG: NAD(+) synthase [Chloroflexi bacterium]|nr:NAD(+) synthase [Chloroflexota bacterium]